MPAPYGLGYGMGAIGAGLAQGQLAATMMKPGLQHQQMQNQMLQQQMDEQKALNVAGSIETPPTEEELTPYDQDIRNRTAMIKSLKAQGQGNAARKLQAELTPLAVSQQTHLLGSGAKSVINGQMGEAVTRLNKGGMKVKAITKNPDGTYTFESLDGDQPSVLTEQQVLGMAENPKDYAQHVMMAQYQSGRLHLGQQEHERKEETDKKRDELGKNRLKETIAQNQAMAEYRRTATTASGGGPTAMSKNVSAWVAAKLSVDPTADPKALAAQAWDLFRPGGGGSSIKVKTALQKAGLEQLKMLNKEYGDETTLPPGHPAIAKYKNAEALLQSSISGLQEELPQPQGKAPIKPQRQDTPTDKYHPTPGGKTIHQHWDGTKWTEELL